MKIFSNIILIAISLTFLSCGAVGSDNYVKARGMNYDGSGSSYAINELSGFDDKNPNVELEKVVEQQNKLILTYSYYFNIKCEDLEKSINILEETAVTNNGYLVNKSNDYIIVKIPTNKVDFYIKQLDKAGEIVYSNKSVTDISHEYYDTKLRLDNLIKARERYLELLKQAENVETTLNVEKELERVTNEIESLKGSLNYYNNQIDYTIIEIKLDKKVTLGPMSWVFYGLYKSVKWLFVWKD